MNINQIKDFTRPSGSVREFRSKYAMHCIKSALLLEGKNDEEINKKYAGHLIESPKHSIWKKKYEYDPLKDEIIQKLQRLKGFHLKGLNLSDLNIQCHSQRNNHRSNRSKRQVNQSQLYPPMMYKKVNSNNNINKTQQFISKPLSSYPSKAMLNDCYKPKDFDIINMNPSIIKTQRANLDIKKQLKERMVNSDIFFKKKHNEDNQRNSNRRENKNQSDILCRNNSNFFIKKSAETYLFRRPLMNKYTSSDESHSNWYHEISKPSMINFSNSEYNPINPNVSNNAKCKKEILKHFNNDIYAIAKKQKSMCGFLDLNHLGAPNPNKDYLNKYALSNKCFHKMKDLCGSYIDLKRNFKD